MVNQYVFECNFCGISFGTDVIKLALHIRKIHDVPRVQNKNSVTLKK